MRNIKIFTLLLISALFLASCGALPRTGNVHTVSRKANSSSSEVVFDLTGPAVGASPEEIVRAFLRAAAVGITDNYAIAKQFLTPAAAKEWNPQARVRVLADDDVQNVEKTATGALKVVSQAVGYLDNTGHYMQSAENSLVQNEFTLIRSESGQWRIASLANGVSMSETLFNFLYKKATLYFVTNNNNSALIPDVRWFPAEGFLTHIAQGILDGASPWLKNAVYDFMPANAKLENGVVIDENSVATVDLSNKASLLNKEQQLLAEVQFRNSLVSSGQVKDIDLKIVGQSLKTKKKLDLSIYPYKTASLFVLRDGVPVQLTEGKSVALLDKGQIKSLAFTDLAISYADKARFGVALGNSGKDLYYLDFANKQVRSLAAGNSFVKPSIDLYSWVWSANADAKGKLLAINAVSGRKLVLSVPSLGTANVKALMVSREGSRLVVSYVVNGQSKLAIFAISRNVKNMPTLLGEPLEVGQGLSGISDFAWISDTELALLAKRPVDVKKRLYVLEIGGDMTAVNLVDEAVELTAGRGKNSLIIMSKNGILYDFSAGLWKVIAYGVDSPAFPG